MTRFAGGTEFWRPTPPADLRGEQPVMPAICEVFGQYLLAI
jgi:hypothetical protein